jgi:hypothetical protein
MRYEESTYGNGPVEAGPLVAIPSVDGPYFTKGKRYPIVGHHAWVYIVYCDKGHQRVISMESGARSAHLPPLTPNEWGWYPSEQLGTFEITT